MERVKKSLPHRSIVDSKQTIAEWFKECDSRRILPWEYDLKEEIYPGIDFGDGPIKRLLNSWAGNYFSQLYFEKAGKEGFVDMETEDCDLMQCVYEILWGKKSKYAYKSQKIDEDNDFDADIMNPFWTPYKAELSNNKLYPWMHQYYETARYGKKRPEDLEELIYRYSEDGYRKVNSRFERFAKLTHTIGNCTLVPLGFNQHGHMDKYNTWSQALEKLVNTKKISWIEGVKKLVSSDGPDAYIKDFFMGSYCNKEDEVFKVIEYPYPNIVKNTKENPKAYEECLEDYLSKVENSIAQRGQEMVKKLCDKLKDDYPEIKDYNFYKKLF